MAEACRALDFPVVSGNVSLYNETNGVAIPPTPGIGGVGLLKDVGHHATLAFKPGDEVVILLGTEGTHLGQSLYQKHITGEFQGAPPPVDLQRERLAGAFIKGLVEAGRVQTVHDISDGGMLVACAEMALAGKRGFSLHPFPDQSVRHAAAFGEDQGRYLLATSKAEAEKILAEAHALGLPARLAGVVGGDFFAIPGEEPIALDALRKAHENWLPSYMGAART
jgi:phosphoribosylformylglycinamidine synthase